LVEHRTENPGVPGSIPGGTTPNRERPRQISGSAGASSLLLTKVLIDFVKCLFWSRDMMSN